jgi:signal transduction histidine kinase
MPFSPALRLAGLSCGFVLCLFLLGVLSRKKRFETADYILLLLLVAGTFWYGANALFDFSLLATGLESTVFLGVLRAFASAGAARVPALLLHFSSASAQPRADDGEHGITGESGEGRRRRWILPFFGYTTVPLAWWLINDGREDLYLLLFAVSVGVVIVLLFYSSRSSANPIQRSFARAFSGALAVSAAGSLAGARSATFVLSTLIPIFVLTRFVYHYNYLGLLISRRLIFALQLGFAVALYLFTVRNVAGFVADEFQVFGAMIELALIVGAALVWIPLYGWMTAFFTRSARISDRFSRRLIEEAARILDLPKRLQFIAQEAGRTFNVKRVLLVASGDPIAYGRFGDVEPNIETLRQIEAVVKDLRDELVHADLTDRPVLRELLRKLRFRYLFPLGYEDELMGLLLLDPSPKVFLDDYEPILLNLSRQISHSIENCRVIEDKISIEREYASQEHLASLGRFAATIAHDVRNPLSAIKTIAQVMREDPAVAGNYEQDLAYIVSQTDRLNSAVQQMLRFSKPLPQSGPAETAAPIDLSDLLETAARMLARQAAGERVSLEWKVQPGLSIKAHPETIEQIVTNLVWNAVQASPKGGSVLFEALQNPGEIQLRVADSGPGIPESIREKIFEPFFTTKQKGTGLGLAIVKKNVRHLNGIMHVESPLQNGCGTRITIGLPLR